MTDPVVRYPGVPFAADLEAFLAQHDLAIHITDLIRAGGGADLLHFGQRLAVGAVGHDTSILQQQRYVNAVGRLRLVRLSEQEG